ncbi:hypothetical protein [Pelagicoccus sp. SDUM812003]|nr:hypothetical protein [Pelagicoccus sp. SDUM812003]MDQ8202694.1 hypothetical protein [Pelagicoccus sp. SDUM812003]
MSLSLQLAQGRAGYSKPPVQEFCLYSDYFVVALEDFWKDSV